MPILIGHGGASAIAPANTIASFEAARGAGVDMIEFDVRPRGSRLLVAHLAPQALRRDCLTLDEALYHLAQPHFSDIKLNVDVKGGGSESILVEKLREHGLSGRSLISSQSADIVERVRTIATDARTASRSAATSPAGPTAGTRVPGVSGCWNASPPAGSAT